MSASRLHIQATYAEATYYPTPEIATTYLNPDEHYDSAVLVIEHRHDRDALIIEGTPAHLRGIVRKLTQALGDFPNS